MKTTNIPLELIDPPYAPLRAKFDEAEILELAHSIKEIGLINPLTVQPTGDRYRVISGHRRLLALTRIGAEEVPCIIWKGDTMTGDLLTLHENLIRSDLTAIELAYTYQAIMEKHGLNITQFAEYIGRSKAHVSQVIAILSYDPELRQGLEKGAIPFGAARVLHQIKDPRLKKAAVRAAASGGITETVAEKWKADANERPPQPPAEVIPFPHPEGEDVSYTNEDVCQLCKSKQPWQYIQLTRICEGCLASIADFMSSEEFESWLMQQEKVEDSNTK